MVRRGGCGQSGGGGRGRLGPFQVSGFHSIEENSENAIPAPPACTAALCRLLITHLNVHSGLEISALD